MQRDLLTFTTESFLEKTVGLNHSFSGSLDVDPADVKAGLKAVFEIDLRNFELASAIKKDFLLRWLNASDNPYSTYTVTKITSASKNTVDDAGATTVKVEGNLDLKGMVRPVTATLHLNYYRDSDLTRQRLAGNLVKCTGEADLNLSDWQIVVPEALKNRIGRSVSLDLNAMGSDAAPPSLLTK